MKESEREEGQAVLNRQRAREQPKKKEAREGETIKGSWSLAVPLEFAVSEAVFVPWAGEGSGITPGGALEQEETGYVPPAPARPGSQHLAGGETERWPSKQTVIATDRQALRLVRTTDPTTD